ncbi:MAG: hypothetical protein CMO30_15885 [Tistrella sp.]|mgnify:CR=1 FL=1|uniref:C4-dicarboxylate ABC transporter substrate-binding protein n=1 Tax=Tistrella mobilis TaxID=171437 RepID=A0A3B9IG29_9PROT|nr:hypothetical protein [Tistrella sp.]MAD38729.1 hypothetical protein [Tistrella sp.]MBA76749.1 hypothetical protein [Tistrella sp.]HAE46247.1 hypothetical protein [Tistrella mobilis]
MRRYAFAPRRATRALISGAALAALSLVLPAAGPATAATFTYGSGVPERSSANQQGVLPILADITRVTDGRVAFTPILGGQLVSIANGFDGIRDGVVDAGFFIGQLTGSQLPYSSLIAEMTGLGGDPYATMGAINEIFFVGCQNCRDEVKMAGIVPILMQSASPLAMMCTKPAATAADLAGRRVSVVGSPEARWTTALGMTPVRSTITDILPALQLGQSDCTLLGMAWIRSYGLQDTVTSVIEMPQGIIAGAVPIAFNRKSWEKISKEDRAAIVKLMPAAVWNYVTDAYITQDAQVKASLADKVTFSPGDADMKSRWTGFQDGEVAALKALARDRGLADGDAVVDRMVATFRIWHERLLPQFQGDRAKFEQILNERVFSKYPF